MRQQSSAFGRYIRAARLGFHLVPSLKSWVRLSDAGEAFRVDMVPEGMLIPGDFAKDPRREHRVWWEGDPKGERLLALSPALQRLGAPLKPLSFLLDEGGEEVRR